MRDQGSLVGLCVQDYKSLRAAVMIYAALVNIQTHTQMSTYTQRQHFNQLIWKAQPAELTIGINFYRVKRVCCTSRYD